MSEYNRSRINGVFRKGRKWRITDLSFNMEELIEASDNDLFNKVRNRIHCLSSLLHPSILLLITCLSQTTWSRPVTSFCQKRFCLKIVSL